MAPEEARRSSLWRGKAAVTPLAGWHPSPPGGSPPFNSPGQGVVVVRLAGRGPENPGWHPKTPFNPPGQGVVVVRLAGRGPENPGMAPEEAPLFVCVFVLGCKGSFCGRCPGVSCGDPGTSNIYIYIYTCIEPRGTAVQRSTASDDDLTLLNRLGRRFRRNR